MSKHKHYEMIVAKAADTELVVFFKCDTGWYFDDTSETIKFHSDTDYFLCLPQHKEYCLHWLNGGEVQDLYDDEWTYCAPLSKTINTDSENRPNTPNTCLLYTSPSPRDRTRSRMPSSA